jgi:hypothetical protein
VRYAQGAPGDRGGVRLGRKALLGLGAAVVAAAVTAYLVIADPFAGPLPDHWKMRPEKALGATLAVPETYKRGVPEESDDDHWVTYTDLSGSIWIGLTLDKKSEDTSKAIADSAAAEMYDDNKEFKENGKYELSMPEGAKTVTDDGTTYRGRPSAENTVTYTTTDSQNPRPRELRILYYKTSAGDMYKLTVSYPGGGDFTARGREVAKTAIDNLEIDKL